MSSNQRQSPRHPARFTIVYDDGASYSSGQVEDISETGLFLATAIPQPVGSILRLQPIRRTDDSLFELRARVVRCVPHDPDSVLATNRDGSVGIALNFVDLDDAGRAAVREMIKLLDKHRRDGGNDPFLRLILPRSAP